MPHFVPLRGNPAEQEPADLPPQSLGIVGLVDEAVRPALRRQRLEVRTVQARVEHDDDLRRE